MIRELIRDRQLQKQETPEHIEAIRRALIAAASSGISQRTPEEIHKTAKIRLEKMVSYRLQDDAIYDLPALRIRNFGIWADSSRPQR